MIKPVQTGMRLDKVENWPVSGHVNGPVPRPCGHDISRATITVRRIGWIDQNGQVWRSESDWINFGSPNGSITPLLISAEC